MQLFVSSLEEEVLPQDLHGRLLLLLDEAGGAAGVLHLPGLLSQPSPQLGPLPLLSVEAVVPDLGQNQKVNRHLQTGP